MAVKLTESAAQRVRDSLIDNGKAIGLRLGVRKTGCSGFAYTIGAADSIAAADHVFESHGVKVLVDEKNLAFLDGMEVDFTREGFSEAFKFRNPNVKSECGCGESFGV
jgi:iron-sulfur cluster assembly protein